MSDSINNSPRVPNGSGTSLPNVGAGDPIRPTIFNRLAEGIDRAFVQPGRGVRVTKTSSSTIISAPPTYDKGHPFKCLKLPDTGVGVFTIRLGCVVGSGGLVNSWRDNETVLGGGSVQYTPATKEGFHAQGAEIMFDITDANYLSAKHLIPGVPLAIPIKEGLYYLQIGAWGGRQMTNTGDLIIDAKITEWNTYSTNMKGVFRPIIRYANKTQMEEKLQQQGVIPICTIDKYERIFQGVASDIYFPNTRIRPFTVDLYEKDGQKKFSVRAATVNRVVPKMNSKYLDASPPPDGPAITGEGYIAVKCTYVEATFFPRTAEVVFLAGANMDAYADTETTSYFPLAKINVTGSGATASYSVIQLSSSNLVVNRLKSGDNSAVWWWDELG